MTGLCYVLQQSPTAGLAKTKADMANKSSHSCSPGCIDFKLAMQTKMLYCLPYIKHTSAVNMKYDDVSKKGRQYDIVALNILMLFQK